MTRRRFLLWVAGVAGTAVVIVVVGWRSPRMAWALTRLEGFGKLPAAKLRTHFPWLAADPAVFDGYVKDYEHYIGRLTRFTIPDPDFYTRFLLSTTFFTSGGDSAQARPVAYTSFYEPGVSPCYNPLAGSPPSDAELGRART
jgi:hypothetical protein